MRIQSLLQSWLVRSKAHIRLTSGLGMLLLLIGGYAVTRYLSSPDDALYLAVAGPMGTADGKAMVRGITLALDEINRTGGVHGRKVQVRGFDDQNNSERARRVAQDIADDDRIPLVLGHYEDSTALAAGAVYQQAGVPAITPSAAANALTIENPWYFRTTFSHQTLAEFLANYLRSILNYDSASVIYARDADGRSVREDFEEAFTALGGELVSDWDYDPEAGDLDARLRAIAQDVATAHRQQQPDIIVLVGPETAAGQLVVELKRAGVPAPIIGDDWTLGQQLAASPEERIQPGFFSNGVYAVAPLLFDVATSRIQSFQEAYLRKYRDAPGINVTSAMYYDATLVAIEALKRANIGKNSRTSADTRQQVRDALAALNSREQAVHGVSGPIYFADTGDLTSDRAPRMGVFRNQTLTSALTQLTPIENQAEIGDLQAALTDNRVLALNDRYLYKTSLVHTGIAINNIGNLDEKDFSCDLDFYLWFRYQGEFEAGDIVFVNSLNPLQLRESSASQAAGGALVERSESHGLHYRLYHVTGRFRADFLPGLRGFKQQHVLGVGFYHRRLNQNNLIYLVDDIGMGVSADRSWLKKIQEDQILSAGSGWTVNQARYFTDHAQTRSLGAPQYLPGQGTVPIFSRFNAGIWIKRTEYVGRKLIAIVQDLIPAALTPIFVILSGAALVGLHLAQTRRTHPQRTLQLLQFCALFMLFLTGEGFLVAWLGRAILPAFGATAYTYYLNVVTLAFEIGWFVLPALLVLLVSRFGWEWFEESTNYVVPKIIRHAVGYVIGILTLFGIIAFVFGQNITSLAATSGALAVLLGFANRVDISNIFAGIGISVTRPFRIGDWVQVNNLEEGRVIDMTSRVTKIETRDRTMLSIPNTMVASGVLENFNYPDDHYRIKIELQTAPVYKFERVEKVLLDAALSTEGVLTDPPPVVVFRGQGDSCAIFALHCFVNDYGRRIQYTQAIWRRIWRHLEIAGIELATPRREIVMIPTDVDERMAPLTSLEKMPLFQTLSSADTMTLSERVRMHRFARGEIIFHQGDRGTSLFIVAEGAVGLWRQFEDGKAVEILRTGVADWFGEVEFLNDEAHQATAIATTDATLFEINADVLKPLLDHYPDLTDTLQQTMSARAIRIEEQIDRFQLAGIDQDAPGKHPHHKTPHVKG